MNRSVRAVAFDLDGTLVDSGQAVLDAVAAGVREVSGRHGAPFDVSRDVLRDALGRPAGEYYRSILPPDLVHLAPEVQIAATTLEVAAMADGGDHLFAAVRETLDTLRERNLRLACISNAQRDYFRAALRYQGLMERFDFTECQEDLPPAARPPFKTIMLQRALVALDVDAAEIVMVGDRAEDIASGLEVGGRTVGVTFGFGAADELARADARIDAFADLAGVIDGFVRG